jgi:hypothetical protein
MSAADKVAIADNTAAIGDIGAALDTINGETL